jgi:glycosyltransferase involved in cell wall biosynthesis/FMN phosphatase YigB (HAD superfamily)
MPVDLEHEVPQLITVDVWDTLIRRQCHPDEVKFAAARFVRLSFGSRLRPEARSDRAIFDCRRAAEVRIGNRTRAEGYDDEYELRQVWHEALSSLLLDADTPLTQLVEAVVRHELEFERRISYADPDIGKLLGTFKPEKGLHILSDFYVSQPELLELVREKHPQLEFVGGMVSCDQHVNKRTGRLYKRIQRQVGVAPEQHLHIGDNRKTDVEKPLELGIRARLYAQSQEDKKREQLNQEFTARMKGNFSPYWELLQAAARAATASDVQAEDPRFQLGVELAPIYVTFVLFVIERARELGAKQIFYFTREGEVLVRIHRAIAETLGHAGLPQAELLEVSRVATFGASLHELSLRELNRFWTMYPRHSMRTFFASLGVEDEPFRSFLARAQLKLDELLVEPWRDERFQSLMRDGRFKAKLEQRLAEKRRQLRTYLVQRGIGDEADKAFVVDIGWRGTIQDNLARAFPHIHWDGAYFALFRFLNAQPANVSKQAFLFNDNQGEGGERHLSPQAPIEMLFNSGGGSVVDYAQDQAGVRATRLNAPGEDRIHELFTRALQAGVLAATPELARVMDLRALSAGDLRVFAYRQTRRLLLEPPPIFARAYFQLEHNETFGVGGMVKHELALRHELVASRSLRKTWDKLAHAPNASGWPRGFLIAHPIAQAPIVASHWARRVQDLRRSYKLAGRIRREIVQAAKKRGLVPVLSDVKAALTHRPAPRPSSDAPRLVKMVGEVDLQDPALRDFNASMAEARASAVGPFVVSWVIPDIGLGSGGHMTLLRFVRHFRELGIVNRIYVQGGSQHKTPGALRRFIEAHYGSMEGIHVFTTSDDLHDSDVLVATHWSTAYEVYTWQKTRFKAYLIQDFEPHFYAKSAVGIFAENTYRMNLFGICASPWLKQIVSQEFGMRTCSFNLGYEPQTYYIDPLIERDANRVVVYMRPTTERRGTELLLAALKLLQKRRPATRIAIFGTGSIPDVGLKAEVLGLQNEEQLRRLHSGSAITLLTSLTNYSLLPIEAMACGSVVVDVDVESMRATFGSDSPIVLAPPDPVAMADQMAELLDDPDRLAVLSRQSIAFAAQYQWTNAFDSVTQALFGAYFGAHAGGSAKVPRFVRGRGGSLVYQVVNGRRRAVSCLDELVSFGGSIDDVIDIEPRRLMMFPLDEADDACKRAAAV